MLLIELRHGNNAMLAFWERLTFFFCLFVPYEPLLLCDFSRCFPPVSPHPKDLLELCRAARQLLPPGNIQKKRVNFRVHFPIKLSKQI